MNKNKTEIEIEQMKKVKDMSGKFNYAIFVLILKADMLQISRACESYKKKRRGTQKERKNILTFYAR